MWQPLEARGSHGDSKISDNNWNMRHSKEKKAQRRTFFCYYLFNCLLLTIFARRKISHNRMNHEAKRVCFLCESVLSIGGVQRVLAVIATALSRHHHVTILTLHDDEGDNHSLYGLDATEVEIKCFHPTPPSAFSSRWHRLLSGLYRKVLPHNALTSRFYARSSFPASLRRQYVKVLNEGDYDAIVGVHAGLSVKLATLRHRLHAPCVTGWMHNSYQALFEGERPYLGGLASHFRFQMMRLDGWVVLCHGDAATYKSRVGLTPTVIHNPLTLVPGTPSLHTSKTFLCIGRMTPLHKGFDILLQAFARFAPLHPEWNLLIVGEGPEKADHLTFIKTKHLEGRVRMAPFTSHIQPYYSQATCYVLASRWEGMPLVLAEAMSHHLPIISSDIPVAREILQSDFALFFTSEHPEELAQRMEEMAGMDTATLDRMGDKAAEAAENFSIQTLLGRWEKLLFRQSELSDSK